MKSSATAWGLLVAIVLGGCSHANQLGGDWTLSNFESGDLDSAIGVRWVESTDVHAGGRSSVSVSVVPTGHGGRSAMEVAGRLDPALPHAWAGAVLYPGGSYDKPADLSKWDILEIVAKGQGRQYRLVMITGIPGSGDENRTSMPFTLSDRWSMHSFDLDELNPDRKHVRGLLLTASIDSEPVFRFQVEEIVVSRHP